LLRAARVSSDGGRGGGGGGSGNRLLQPGIQARPLVSFCIPGAGTVNIFLLRQNKAIPSGQSNVLCMFREIFSAQECHGFGYKELKNFSPISKAKRFRNFHTNTIQ
jgi:hypothetical protein